MPQHSETDMTGVTGAKVANSTSTVVSSGANTNGVSIKSIQVSNRGGIAYLQIGSRYFIYTDGHSGSPTSTIAVDIFAEKGDAIKISSSVTTSHVSINYKVL